MHTIDEQELKEALDQWLKAERNVVATQRELSVVRDRCPDRPQRATVEEWNVYVLLRSVYDCEVHESEVQYSQATERAYECQRVLHGWLPSGVWIECGDWLLRKVCKSYYGYMLESKPLVEEEGKDE